MQQPDSDTQTVKKNFSRIFQCKLWHTSGVYVMCLRNKPKIQVQSTSSNVCITTWRLDNVFKVPQCLVSFVLAYTN